eukprot:TRINITY_DN11062_c0_g1_i1.p1 TRINITY_DN11062_c0_g1~~TRINITY_DN11062_c0_g1_i1.p1  ORF type:complete len:111 (+),score=16.73 TRINITY_DN11062_c0_g1_i1:134-466(+)
MPKKKAGGKKKKKSTSSKLTGPTEPILPVVCPACGALHAPLKSTSLCTLCFQAQDRTVVFSLARSKDGPNAGPAAEAATKENHETSTKPKKKKATKKKASVKKKKSQKKL